MKYLVDSDWVIDWLSGRREAYDVIASCKRAGIAISAITYLKVAEGIAGSQAPARDRQRFRVFSRGTRLLVASRAIAVRAAALRLDLRRRGRPVNDRVLDILIVATAIEHNLTLVTRNLRDDRDIPGLRRYAEA